jgi:hypothetical protein
VSPTLKWGILVGCLVALVDSVSLLVSRGYPVESNAAQYVAVADQVANVVLFSVAGMQVGRATRIVRAAAEAGVLAGVIAGVAATAWAFALPALNPEGVSTQEIVGTFALNVAMGGVLAMLNGWIASRGATSRRGRPSK